MKLPEPWERRVRFTLGVLLVWISLSCVSGLIHLFSLEDTTNGKLRMKQFCVVEDFMASNNFGPTPCYVYDREYQSNPLLDSSGHVYHAEADRDTLVMVDMDVRDSKMVKNDHGIEFDHRLVSIYFISGSLSGRKGLIARYKLTPRTFPRPD